MLRLNSNDNQGVRYLLLGALVDLDRDDEAQHLIERYDHDSSAEWAYTTALLAFRREGDSAVCAASCGQPWSRTGMFPTTWWATRICRRRRRPTSAWAERTRPPATPPSSSARGGVPKGPFPGCGRRSGCRCPSAQEFASQPGRSSATPSCGCRKSREKSGNWTPAACRFHRPTAKHIGRPGRWYCGTARRMPSSRSRPATISPRWPRPGTC